MENSSFKYFLAANSCKGFISYFDKCYNPRNGWRAYIIKGGPGTGKSSFMKAVAKGLKERGRACEEIPCSSDPDSLDGVIFSEIRSVILDGTAPHTLDPKYAGAVEKILNFGEFWQEELLTCSKDKIISLTDKNKALHKTASLYIKTAGEIKAKNGDIALEYVNLPKLKDYAERLSEKLIKGKGEGFELKEAFLSGIGPKGIVNFQGTVTENCRNLVILKDEYGSISRLIYDAILKKAREKQYAVYCFKNYLITEYIDGLYIPQLQLGILTESGEMPIESRVRRINTQRFLREFKAGKIKLNKKFSDSLLSFAVDALAEAKSIHDDLEKIYIGAMDFKALEAFTEEFLKGMV